MSDHLQPEPSEIVQRYSFNTRVRRSQESVATYVAELKRIAEHCNFGDNARLNEMILDRLVCGIANDKWKQRLLAEDPKKLNFDKAYSLLLSLEASEKQVKVLTQPEATQVHQLRPSRPSSNRSAASKGRTPLRKPTSKDARPRYRCGGEHNADRTSILP